MAYTTINKSSEHFNTKLYTGDGNNARAITGVGFQPDFTWLKTRNDTQSHQLFDAVRGATKNLHSNTTGAEATYSDALQSFNSDGFTIGTSGGINGSGDTVVAWNWKANGAGSANTDGSINSIATSANATSGFSIVKYTGNGSTNQTIGHGLGTVPDFVIVKQTNTTRNWPTYSRAMGNGVAFLDINDAWNGGYTNYFYPAGMTTTTFGISDNGNINESGGTYIAYVFSSRTGYSKFGKYTGGGSSFPFIYTGFKPSWLMIKRTNSAENWHIFDIKRNTYYPTSSSYGGMATRLIANTTGGDDLSQGGFEFLSNGLKMTTSWSGGNGNGDTFIYMCFGQSLVGTNNVPCTAR